VIGSSRLLRGVDRDLSADPRQRQVHAAETRLLYENACTGIVATIVIAAILAYAQSDVRPRAVVVAWLLFVLLVSGARYALVRRYWRAAPDDVDSHQWRVAFAIGAAMAAVGWVAAAIVLYAPSQPLNQAFLVFVVGGVMLGGASLLAPRPEAFLISPAPDRPRHSAAPGQRGGRGPPDDGVPRRPLHRGDGHDDLAIPSDDRVLTA
jgi:hypothetical protein